MASGSAEFFEVIVEASQLPRLASERVLCVRDAAGTLRRILAVENKQLTGHGFETVLIIDLEGDTACSLRLYGISPVILMQADEV